jgi:hypothetical protein
VLEVYTIPGWDRDRWWSYRWITIYSDGTVLIPIVSVGSQPALMKVDQLKISQANVARLIQHAVAAGVGTGNVLANSMGDRGWTVITVMTADGVQRSLTWRLRFDLQTPGQSLDQQLNHFLIEIDDLENTLVGAGAVLSRQTYQPQQIAVHAVAWHGADQPRTWPGPPLHASRVATDWTDCIMLSDDQAQVVMAAAATATAYTPWTSNNGQWLIAIRPLYPDEHSRADLQNDLID